MQKYSFLQGAFILALAGVVTKLFGALYRIPLTWLIGDEGMGLYGMSYPLYNMLLVLSTAGIPVAISKLVSEYMTREDSYNAKRVFSLALLIMVGTGLFFSALLFWGARPLVEYGFLTDPRAYYAVVAIAPAILLVTIMASFRGFFQGLQTMIPTACSQLLEQLVRAGTALLLAYYLVQWGIEYAAAGAAFGAATGALAGLCLLVVWYLRRARAMLGDTSRSLGEVTTSGRIVGRIFALAIPVSLASLVMPLTQNIDVAIVPARLVAAGYTAQQATALFGQLSQMAMTLINLPTIITIALAMSLVPAISEAYTLQDYPLLRARVASAIRVTVILMLPAFIGLWLLADEIMAFLYGQPEAGVALAGLAGSALFLGLHQTTSGVLQGLGRTDIPVKNLLVGAVAKVILTWNLTYSLGIQGAALGTVATFLLAAGLNLLAIYRLIGLRLGYRETLVKPGLAILAMALVAGVGHPWLERFLGHPSLATAIIIVLAAAVYVLVLLQVGGVSSRDLEMVPGVGPRLARILQRLRLLRS